MADFLDFIKQVKDASDIVSVIGSYVELKKSGQDFWARCPFHGEKTASFSVSQSKQIFKCFGCGESGDVIEFVKKYESASMFEALTILANRANVPIPEFSPLKTDKQLAQKKKKRELHLSILKDAAKFYFRQYYSPKGQNARAYMQNRGFAEDICKQFGIGFSPDTFSLVEHLKNQNYAMDACKEIGVLQQTKDGRYIDALANRLIVPIFDINQRVIAFGGRALDQKTESFGKYKNTSETPLFLKKNNLYGINFAKVQKQRLNLPYIIVVEGYMDVISMTQAGISQCVASMGTSLTEHQAKQISRLVDTVYICYDGDSAGQKATIRGMDILTQAGLEVKVVSVPNNLDPDDFIKQNGVQAFNDLLTKSLPLIDYKLSILEKHFDISNPTNPTSNANLTKFVKGAVMVLKGLDSVTGMHYIKLISAKTGYSEEFLLRQLTQKKVEKSNSSTTEVSAISKEDNALCFVASCILANQPYAKLTEKPHTDLPFLTAIFDYIFDCYKANTIPQADMAYTIFPNGEKSQYDLVVGYNFQEKNAQKDQQYYLECQKIVTENQLKYRRQALLEQLQRQDISEQSQEELLKQIEQLNEKIFSQ